MPIGVDLPMDQNQLLSGMMDAFARAVSQALSESGPEEVHLDWSVTPEPQEDSDTWNWWSGGLSAHPGANFFLGAPEETWEKLGRGGDSENIRENAFALMNRCFTKAVVEHFGERESAQDAGPSGAPASSWTHITITVRFPAGQWPNACCVLSPEFEKLLSSPQESVTAPAPVRPVESARNAGAANDMLMHVQVPVSVSFGGTQMRMKDLLHLATGSVVELDQSLHDNVEVRVNDRVIARGEVVAVDGHYGVRVLELVSKGN
ncbi:MAG TPA: FliM/FliN family flagellar motor switch protein [Bryobacteraceae bacterium]